MKSLFALLILTLLTFSAAGVELRDDCAGKLIGDRYWSVVRECLRQGILGDEELEKIAASERPLNPYAHMTPLVKTTAAFRVFVNLLADPLVQKNWKTTRVLIQDVVKQRHKLIELRDQAHHDTKEVLISREIKSFTYSEEISATILEDGLPVIAYVSLPHTLKVLRMTDGEEIYSGPLPDIPGNREGKEWSIKWHTEADGRVRLYLAATKSTDNHRHLSTLIFRFDMNNPRLEQLPYEIYNASNEGLESAAPGMLYVSVLADLRQKISTEVKPDSPAFEATSPRGVMVRIFDDHIEPEHGVFFNDNYPPVVKNGKIVSSDIERVDGGFHFLRSDGQVMRSYGHHSKIEVTIDGDPNFKYEVDYPRDASMISKTTMYQTKEGRVILAALFYEGAGKSWHFYEVGDSHKHKESGPGDHSSEYAWVRDQSEKPLFLDHVNVGQGFQVELRDPLTGEEVYRSESQGSLVGALTAGRQVYFWTLGDGKIHIYSLFNAIP